MNVATEVYKQKPHAKSANVDIIDEWNLFNKAQYKLYNN